ncbi:MAG TPA: hypothetical protein DET40_03995 [Lentisphaeria bacterium]|nr:MAG: hypothetical protein A2X45_15210 [Lentisphaerae bacterium GWF2_50_93]HCE42688.1 hypothetical protein [Lentisphaeria bacterium]
MKKIIRALAVFASVSLFCVFAEDAISLLSNGSFEAEDGGVPMAWKGYSADNPAKVDSEHPESCAKSMKVVLKKAGGEGYGSITQDIPITKENSKMILSGELKSTKKGMCFLQIKLKKGKQELKRLTSGESDVQWGNAKIEFSTETADKVSVLCRFKQTDEFLNESAWFANLKLIEQK